MPKAVPIRLPEPERNGIHNGTLLQTGEINRRAMALGHYLRQERERTIVRAVTDADYAAGKYVYRPNGTGQQLYKSNGSNRNWIGVGNTTSTGFASAVPLADEISLTEFRTTDKPALLRHLAERQIYERTLRIPFPYTEADADAWLGIVAAATEQHGEPIHFAIRNSDQLLIGSVGFEGVTRGHRAEIGYWLARPFWGRGIMSAVVGRACEHAVARWNLVRITAHVFSSNEASARVLVKNGFEFEGFLRKHYQKDGLFLDSRLFALLR